MSTSAGSDASRSETPTKILIIEDTQSRGCLNAGFARMLKASVLAGLEGGAKNRALSLLKAPL
jgi:hypothetical protein